MGLTWGGCGAGAGACVVAFDGGAVALGLACVAIGFAVGATDRGVDEGA